MGYLERHHYREQDVTNWHLATWAAAVKSSLIRKPSNRSCPRLPKLYTVCENDIPLLDFFFLATGKEHPICRQEGATRLDKPKPAGKQAFSCRMTARKQNTCTEDGRTNSALLEEGMKGKKKKKQNESGGEEKGREREGMGVDVGVDGGRWTVDSEVGVDMDGGRTGDL